jgi:hypothetical protein
MLVVMVVVMLVLLVHVMHMMGVCVMGMLADVGVCQSGTKRHCDCGDCHCQDLHLRAPRSFFERRVTP